MSLNDMLTFTHSSCCALLDLIAGVHWASCGGARPAASFPCFSLPPLCCWRWYAPGHPSSGSKPVQPLRLGGTGAAAAAAAKAPAATAALPSLHDLMTCMSTTKFHRCMTFDTFDAVPIPSVESIAQSHRLLHSRTGSATSPRDQPAATAGCCRGAANPGVTQILLALSFERVMCGYRVDRDAAVQDTSSCRPRPAQRPPRWRRCNNLLPARRAQPGTLVAAVSRLRATLGCTLCPE
jgi:hypothetical protein